MRARFVLAMVSSSLGMSLLSVPAFAGEAGEQSSASQAVGRPTPDGACENVRISGTLPRAPKGLVTRQRVTLD